MCSKKIKLFIGKVKRKKCGRRYQFIFKYFQKKMHKHHILKIMLSILGIILIIIGFILFFTPGPGSVFFIAGLILLAISSLYTAKVLDKGEMYYKKKEKLLKRWLNKFKENH